MPQVLIVEDDRVIRNLIIHALKLHLDNFIFETCSNGEDAVDRIINNNIDLIIMDLRMPKMDGVQAIRNIREFSKVPVIVVSAYGDSRSREAAKNAGATMFFQKPPDYVKLASNIKRLLKRQTAQLSRKPILKQWYKDLNYLLAQEAQYGGNAPLELHNQIEEIKRRIWEMENE